MSKTLSPSCPSNCGLESQTDLSFLRCLSVPQRFKLSFGVVSQRSASCGSEEVTYTRCIAWIRKGNWNIGRIGVRDFTLTIISNSWTVKNCGFFIQGSRGFGRIIFFSMCNTCRLVPFSYCIVFATRTRILQSFCERNVFKTGATTVARQLFCFPPTAFQSSFVCLHRFMSNDDSEERAR